MKASPMCLTDEERDALEAPVAHVAAPAGRPAVPRAGGQSNGAVRLARRRHHQAASGRYHYGFPNSFGYDQITNGLEGYVHGSSQRAHAVERFYDDLRNVEAYVKTHSRLRNYARPSNISAAING
ncbi:MAG: hypothetical protein AAGE52_01790 [Myxococcota bacterium]